MAGNVSYTLDNYILPSVIRLSHLPVANTTFQIGDIGSLCDGEISTAILRTILSAREGFYLRYVDLTADANGVVHIPSRTIGGRIHKVQFLSGNVLLPAARIEPSDLTNLISPPTSAYAFYVQGNDIVAIPATVPVRVWYFVRPSSLTPQANCAQITALTATTITVSALPSNFSTAFLTDFVQDQPPFGLLAFDRTPTNITGNVLTYASGVIPAQLALGDWVCPAGQSPVAQIPLEFLPVLTQRVTVKVLETQGHMQRLQAAQAKLLEIEKDVLNIINPRIEENPRKITPDRGIVSPGYGSRSNWIVGK